MENASKALLIAGSVLMSLIVIGALMLAMREISDYKNINEDAELEQQTLEFNNTYSTYNRKKIRGNDIVSLMNRIVDYNTRYSGQGFTQMETSITISDTIRNNLTYDGTNRLIGRSSYNQSTITEIVGQPSNINTNISGGRIREIENKYGQTYANLLASEISNIESIKNNSLLTASGKNLAFDEDFSRFPKSASEYGGISTIFEDACVYYEYVQFKRAYFDCTSTQYDQYTGRIIKMEFVCTGIGV